MSAITEILVLDWKGQKLEIKAPMEVVNRIENHDINLAIVAKEAAAGNAKLSHLATIMFLLLQAAGDDSTWRDIHAAMYGGGPLADEDVIKKSFQMLDLIYPQNSGGTKSKKKQQL
jgi:hypothetical protein